MKRRVFGGAVALAFAILVTGLHAQQPGDKATDEGEAQETKASRAVAAYGAAVTLIEYGREHKDALAILGGVNALLGMEKALKPDEKESEKEAAEALKNTKEMLQAALTEAGKFASDDIKGRVKYLQGEVDGLGRGTPSGGGIGRAWKPLINAKGGTVSKSYTFERKQVGRICITRLLNPNSPIKITVTDPAGNVIAHRPGKPLEYEFVPPKEQNYKVTIQNNDQKVPTQVQVVTN